MLATIDTNSVTSGTRRFSEALTGAPKMDDSVFVERVFDSTRQIGEFHRDNAIVVVRRETGVYFDGPPIVFRSGKTF